MSLGHAFTDMNQGALPAIIPYLVAAGGLKYAQVAGFSFAISAFSSMLQPLFGIMADKSSKSRLLAAGVLLGGCGLAMIGLFPNHYWLMFSVAIISGIGVAAYHPEAARMANKAAGKKKGGGMSIFTVGGGIGFSAGPLLATPLLIFFGLKGTVFLAVPSIIMFIIFMKINSRLREIGNIQEEGIISTPGEVKNEWKKFLWLSIAIVVRSTISHNVNTFLPLYLINVLNYSKAESGMALSFLFFVGSAATVAGGFLSDRIGVANIIKIGMIILIPTLFFFTKITSPLGAWLILLPLAFGLYMISTPVVLLGQKYLPVNVGFASGVTLGLSVSIGGLTTPLFGSYADHNGLTALFKLLCILPFIGAFVALTLKPSKHA